MTILVQESRCYSLYVNLISSYFKSRRSFSLPVLRQFIARRYQSYVALQK